MPKNIDKELETAILSMTVKDKDKVLLKLIAKNQLLVEQMRFQLLEDVSDLTLKRKELKEEIIRVSKMRQESPGWMMMDMRDLNGRITLHVKITKDKYGEVELTVALLKAFLNNRPDFYSFLNKKNETLSDYVVKRAESLMKKLKALNEDYYIEFYDDVNDILDKLHSGSPAIFARNAGLLTRWEY